MKSKNNEIIDIKIKVLKLKFHKKFTIAYESVDEPEAIFIKITDKDWNTWFGNTNPDPEVTWETVEDIYNALKKHITKDFFEYPLDNWYAYHLKIQKVFKKYPAAQHAIEEAVLNLWAKRNKLPLHALFWWNHNEVETMITICFKDSQKELEDEINEQLEKWFHTFKLKVWRNLKEDIENVKLIKKLLPKDKKIVLDANQWFTLDEAIEFLESIKDIKIELIEQPIAKENIEWMKKLKQMKIMPIIADEAIVWFDDAIKLLSWDYVDWINVKLMKCGWPINFMKIYHYAKNLDKIVMIWCMYESDISMATWACLAASLPIDFIDLDTWSLDFHNDPAVWWIIRKWAKIILDDNIDLVL